MAQQIDTDRSRPLILGHRGASAYAKENTLAALRLALDQGADGVEIDVRRCADGTLVLSHDAHLPDGTPIVDLDRRDLRRAVPEIPDLTEALALLDGAFVNVEIKNVPDDPDFDEMDGVARDVAAILTSTEFRGIVSSFNPATVEHVAATAPTIRTGLLTAAAIPADQGIRAAAGHAAWHPHWSSLAGHGEDAVHAAHAAGLAVIVWTVDDPDTARLLDRYRVDGIITNDPPALLAALK